MNKAILGSAVILSIIVILGMMVMGMYNRAVTMEENINTSLSNISKEEQRRVDLFNNLVDAVESYNKFEKETLTEIIKARAQANAGNVETANLMLAAVVEAYPQLKSNENYKQAMLEFSITENRIAGYREQYNNDVRGYNQFVRSFPANVFLNITGYARQNYEYLDFEVNNAEARDLFKSDEQE